jgi:hypothetical protein
MIESRWYEKELSEGKPYVVMAIDSMSDGTMRVTVEKNNCIGYASDYRDRYRSVKLCESALIKKALNNIEPAFPEHDKHDYAERNADIGDYLNN